MDLSIHDPLTMLVFVGLIFLLLPSIKINGRSIEVIKGHEKYLYIIGAIACIAGVYLFVHGSVLTSSQETLTPEDIAAETVTSRETTETQTPAETQTPTETTNTQSSAPYVSDPQSIATPPRVNVLPYLSWRYVTSDHKPNMQLTGSKFVIATINIKNGGDVRISTSPSCWNFVYDKTYYHYDSMTGLYNPNGYPDINPGESGTVKIAYVVEGDPTNNASIAYFNPYFDI